MGISLYGLTPATTYDALIKTGDNEPLTASLKVLSDGVGTNLPIEASTTGINFTGTTTVGGMAVANTTQVAAKQDTLVSGTNIKTINGTSVLGSGNIVTPTTSPSGVSGAIQFSNGSAFASDAANLFWDNTNKRLGVGTNAPSGTLSVRGENTTYGSAPSIKIQNSAGATHFEVRNSGLVSILDGYIELTTAVSSIVTTATTIGAFGSLGARLGIKGSGSTSATTSLLVQNSGGVASLQVTDDGSVYNLGKGAITSNNGFGRLALINNTTGTNNTANGVSALQSNTTGSANTADGVSALASNLTGSNNTAIGRSALTFMTAGSANTAVGAVALYSTTGSNNTALGYEAGFANTTGANNTLLGQNTVTGNFSGSVIIGKDAIATASNQFVVGSTGTNAGAVTTESNSSTKVWNVIINGVAQKILLA